MAYDAKAKKKYRTKNRIRSWFESLKYGAKKRGIPFELTLKDLEELLPKTCPIYGMPLEFTNTGKQEPCAPSVDRIDNKKGYTRDNVIIVCLKANKQKSNMSIDELVRLADFYKELVAPLAK